MLGFFFALLKKLVEINILYNRINIIKKKQAKQTIEFGKNKQKESIYRLPRPIVSSYILN
jgi:hypothetical protein